MTRLPSVLVRVAPERAASIRVALICVAPIGAALLCPPAVAGEPVDWIASDAFGDIAARAGWRPVTDVSVGDAREAPVVPGCVGMLEPCTSP